MIRNATMLLLLLAAQAKGQTITPGPAGEIDARQYGVIPNTDCTAALQNLANNAPQGSTIVLPAGKIIITSTIDFTPQNRLGLRGSGTAWGLSPMSTLIVGNVPGPLVGRNLDGRHGDGSAYIKGIGLHNSNANGICVQLEGVVGASIEQCVFLASTGLVIGKETITNIGIEIRGCVFQGSFREFPKGVGARLRGRGAIYDPECFQWDTALDLSGTWSRAHSHCEVCNVGIRTGRQSPLNGVFNDLAFETCLTAMQILKPTNKLVCNSVNIYGDQQHPPGGASQWPQYGIDVEGGSSLIFNACDVGGSFSAAAIRLQNAQHVVCTCVEAGNRGMAGSTTAWDVTLPAQTVLFIQCNVPQALIEELLRRAGVRVPNATMKRKEK